MKSPKEIEDFIMGWFSEYRISYDEFFSECKEDGNLVVHPLIENGQLCMPVVGDAATLLGVDLEDVLSTNADAPGRWLDKFPYFSYRNAFEEAYRRSTHDDRYEYLRLMEVLKNGTYLPEYPTRYDYDDVIDRMENLLKDRNKVVPGIYHQGAEMTGICISANNFFHFNDMDKLIESYLETWKRLEELFFNSFNDNLEKEEIQEYNFLVCTLGVIDRNSRDSFYPFYDFLKKLAPVYKEEGYTKLQSYVKIKRGHSLMPWRCVEFIKDRDSAQRFVEIFPESKQDMRKYAMSINNFLCKFTWSDANTVQPDPLEVSADEALGVPPQEPAPEITTVYVPKTKDELRGDDEYAQLLLTLSGPVSNGGVVVPQNEVTCEGGSFLDQVQKLVDASRKRKAACDVFY